MLACADEFRPMSARVPILDATLKTTLANKVALFLGYGLGDHDFARVITTVKDELGQYMPKSYAVVNAATSFQREYWSEFGVQVIVEDLTTFLKKLSAVSASSPSPAVLSGRDDWRKNDYFRALERIHTMPSETQVIDAFLAHLLDELRAPGRDLATVLARAEQAVVAVLTARDAFEALKQVSTDLFGRIRSTATTKEAAELAVDREIQDRSRIGQGFRRKGQAEIARGDSLLLYSQSKRVAEFLAGVPGGTQDTCQVFVAECRPRSQAPFRDAIAFLELIRSMNGGYRDVKLIPDAIVGNLISRKQVTKVILGAHAAYRRNGKLEAFVNTAGSVLIVDSAIKHGIPIFVVAEEAKVKDLGPADPLPVITYNQEGSIFDSVNNQLAELNIDGKVVGVNIGYDLCAGGPNVTLVTEL
jgi:translation initiation factor 2B subunit (eIF-2B alpha/beta/delta family)